MYLHCHPATISNQREPLCLYMYLVQSYPLIGVCLLILITFLLLIAGELTYSSMLPYVQVFN